jgi:hypothetical protein
MGEEPDYNEIAYSIWCDKIGSKCGWYGFCDEAFEEDITHSKANKKQSSKRSRREKHNKKISDIYSFTKRIWMIPYYEHNSRLIQNNFSWRTKRFYKKYSHKQIRKYEGEISNGNCYRKVWNYKCEIS